tara:strand:+ start:19 stop:345 length:327 start_codon:yes stop_codon:yes gene_type:complete
MKKFLLLALLIGLPSPLFAGESTSGYKKLDTCADTNGNKVYKWFKKEGTQSRKGGTQICSRHCSSSKKNGFVIDMPGMSNCKVKNCKWIVKGVSMDTAKEAFGECNRK